MCCRQLPGSIEASTSQTQSPVANETNSEARAPAATPVPTRFTAKYVLQHRVSSFDISSLSPPCRIGEGGMARKAASTNVQSAA